MIHDASGIGRFAAHDAAGIGRFADHDAADGLTPTPDEPPHGSVNLWVFEQLWGRKGGGSWRHSPTPRSSPEDVTSVETPNKRSMPGRCRGGFQPTLHAMRTDPRPHPPRRGPRTARSPPRRGSSTPRRLGPPRRVTIHNSGPPRAVQICRSTSSSGARASIRCTFSPAASIILITSSYRLISRSSFSRVS